MKVAFGSDHAGFKLKEAIIKAFAEHVHCLDLGTDSEESCDYPDYADRVCRAVVAGEAERGILICGTGIGMSIRANRFKGIRAALCHDHFTAQRSRLHNDANVLAMGSQVVTAGTALELVRIFLETEFDRTDGQNERHVRRINKMDLDSPTL
ncbi:ribose 5-phosphate isomerase B [bacterium]|nr:ribose 5-phosphate isomerase B [bacterium]